MSNPSPPSPEVMLPQTCVVIPAVREAYVLDVTGEILRLTFRAAVAALRGEKTPPIVCHGRRTAQRLGVETLRAFDVLELYAFVRPATFCLPTASGLAQALGLVLPRGHEDELGVLLGGARALLEELARTAREDPREARIMVGLARAMDAGGWPWAKPVLGALGTVYGDAVPHSQNLRRAFAVWERLSEWEDRGGETKPGDIPVSADQTRRRLGELLAGRRSESRPEQQAYALGVSAAFDPCDHAGQPRFVLAEAGTGVGKTLGYVAPASVWAEQNSGTVWLSTYTRNLQRQLDGELDRLYPDAHEKKRRVVVRKGRENYFCILNFSEALGRMNIRPDGAIALGLVARWAGKTRDGDMVGGDFPAWLSDVLGRGLVRELTDTRGECTYSACEHFNVCFIEHSKRRAKRARLVIANHALVMVQAALGAAGDEPNAEGLPTRYVFDEGHHLFNAADAAFAAHLSGVESADLRRWILGREEGANSRTRARGLKKRLQDLSATDDKLARLLDDVCHVAKFLPGPGWQNRLADNRPLDPAELFLSAVRQQVYARDKDARGHYSLECPAADPVEGLLKAAHDLEQALGTLAKPVRALIRCLLKKLTDEAADLETSERTRIEGLARSLERRAAFPLETWQAMLKAMRERSPAVDFVDWLSVERIQGRDVDVAFNRHWIDPTKPFAAAMAETAEGIVVTSASLCEDGGHEDGDDDAVWAAAEARTGAGHFKSPIIHVAQPSPFDYARQTRILVVRDVNKNSLDQVAAAYRELFLASHGGALGLFTAISRLRGVYDRLAGSLDEQGLALYAQHVDALDIGTLVDIFRAEENSCLLGTDAVRDGVDVPGESLRLIVFDRVPWPRPDILTRARRQHFGGRAYDETLTRLKLKQAFGRLVRKHDDRGVFVMLDGALPTRLTTAFPESVEVQRVGLKEALAQVRNFLSNDALHNKG